MTMSTLLKRLVAVAASAAVATTLLVAGGPAQAVDATTDATTDATADAATIPPPQDDPFYTPPDGFADTAPGTVLRTRQVTVAAAASWPVKIKAWQLLYRTTGAKGEPIATVTTAMLPWNAEPDPDRPLLSYQPFEDSVSLQCAPSYQLRQSLNWDNSGMQLELIFMAAAVRKGWAVTVPDHEGPNSAFTAGKVSGHATLDAIRATESFAPMGLSADTRVGMWGYSGGAHATGWAAELQPNYAPELNVVGAAAGGMPPEVEPVYDNLNGGLASGLALTGVAGLAEGYPELRRWLDEHTTAEGKAALDAVRGQCLPANVTQFAFRDIDRYVTVEDPLAAPVPAAVLADNTMSPDASDAPPMFVYHAIPDELLPIRVTDELVDDRCANGATIRYQRDLLSEHIIAAATGAPDALIWLTDRLEGDGAAPRGCQIRNVASSLAHPKAIAVFGRVLLDSLIDLAGRPVGPAPGWG